MNTKEQKISIASARGRAGSRSLHLLRKDLQKRGADVRVFTSEITKDKEQKKENNARLEAFCRQSENIVCVDGSLPTKKGVFNGKESSVRLLIVEPFGYIFTHAYAMEHPEDLRADEAAGQPQETSTDEAAGQQQENSKDGAVGQPQKTSADEGDGQLPNEYSAGQPAEAVPEKSTAFLGFTHILAGTAYLHQVIARTYALSANCTILDDWGNPLAEDLTREASIAASRQVIESRYPQTKGKKLLCLLGSGEEDGYTDFSSFDIRAFAASLPEGWVLITNLPPMLRLFEQLPCDKKDSFVSSAHIPATDYLYCCDVLIGSEPWPICQYASTGKPFYAVETKENAFTRYLKACCPSLLLKDLHGLSALLESHTLTGFQQDFRRKFAPAAMPSSADRITDLLLGEGTGS